MCFVTGVGATLRKTLRVAARLPRNPQYDHILTNTISGRTIPPENATVNPDGRSLFDFIGDALAVLRKDWPKNMEISSFEPLQGRFVLTGDCPYGPHRAAFLPVSSSYKDERVLGDRWIAALQCVSCNKFILGIVGFVPKGDGTATLKCLEHYPVGKPDDSVSTDVPDGIREDFREALRCRWVDAFKATVLLCRRALQVSCDREQAKGNDLYTQIDDLASNQHITEPLRKMAHRIRLLGKKGAHGDYSDIDDTTTAKDADDAVTFMHHYLEHVYILPARLADGTP